MAVAKKKYITDKKTGKPLYMDTKNPQEAGVGSIGKMAIKLGVKAISKIANTKPGVKATKAVAKKVQTQAVKSNKKTVEKVAKMQEKTKADKIAKNSVKVVKVDNNTPRSVIANRNKVATEMAAKRKSGELAKLTGSRVNTNPAAGRTGNERIVIKINSAKAKANVTKATKKTK
jgi:hypothetical protein